MPGKLQFRIDLKHFEVGGQLHLYARLLAKTGRSSLKGFHESLAIQMTEPFKLNIG
jgi:hypothetical protein